MSVYKVKPGIHKNFPINIFTRVEQDIIYRLSSEWYITTGGYLEVGESSSYRYLLFKPTDHYQERFNISREIITVFSLYPDFLPRTLDAFDAAAKRHQSLRIERVCGVLISQDSEIESKMQSLLKKDAEHQVVVPFSYSEFTGDSWDSYLVRNKFTANFYSRNLFDFKSPLKRDTYFFGRSDLVQRLASRHKSGENSGLFGLRKTGKTSIVYGVRRRIEADGGICVFLECESPSFHMKRWFKTLKFIIDEIKTQNKLSVSTSNEELYVEENAASVFERDLRKIQGNAKKGSILLIFDEVEHLTPGVSISSHWRDGRDFIYFWQTLRSIFQKNESLLSYLISGTNPKCVEIDRIHGADNPIFCQIPCEYIQPFDVPQTRDMVRTLGKIMGLKFDELLYSRLTEDFGGHPFLIRMMCSHIHEIVSSERPVKVGRTTYEEGMELFEDSSSSYVDMILSVLKEFYNDELEMLQLLAIQDIETFEWFVSQSREYTNHLEGYGLLGKDRGKFFFKIEAVRKSLININKYKKINLSEVEILAEISERRNKIEPKLRSIARKYLRQFYGEDKAKEITLNIYGGKRKLEGYTLSYREIFDPNKINVFFEDIRKIIIKEWDVFQNVFDRDKERFDLAMKVVNKYRIDAHAKSITQEEFSHFRVQVTWLENRIEEQE
jgi:hypothetical protein